VASSEEDGETVGGSQQEPTGDDLYAGIGFQMETTSVGALLREKMCSPLLAQSLRSV
jgi:hypothetical protein